MKTSLLVAITSIVAGIIILVTSFIIIIPITEASYQKECIYHGGKVTGFLKCTITHIDYAVGSPTVFINLGATDPENKNPVSPKEMAVYLGENSTVTWINTDGQQHFINFENLAIGPLNQGDKQSITFNHTGVYKYFSADSPSISGSVIVKYDMNRNDPQTWADILSEINRQGIIHQKNGTQQNFDEQMILMRERQKEIASEILGIKISDAYVAKGWNFPFKESSKVTIVNPEFEKPLCNIPENIPDQLQIIQQSEMFQMFAKKYSQYQLMIDISDERYNEGLVHYDLIATSDDESFTASTWFHLDSCTTEKIFSPYILFCKDTTNGNSTYTRIKSEIISSLNNDDFCTIQLESWHRDLRNYQEKISEKIHTITRGDVLVDSDSNLSEKSFWELRLGLLNDIIRYYESENSDYKKMQENVAKYDRKFGSLPDELLEIIEQKK